MSTPTIALIHYPLFYLIKMIKIWGFDNCLRIAACATCFTIIYLWIKNDHSSTSLSLARKIERFKKEKLPNSRLWRLIAAISCTAMSYMGLGVAFYGALNVTYPYDSFFHFLSLLWSAAWIAYFLILFLWIKNSRVPKPIMATGTTLGTLSVITTMHFSFFALPAIILMLHVHARSFDIPKTA